VAEKPACSGINTQFELQIHGRSHCSREQRILHAEIVESYLDTKTLMPEKKVIPDRFIDGWMTYYWSSDRDATYVYSVSFATRMSVRLCILTLATFVTLKRSNISKLALHYTQNDVSSI